MSRRKSNSNQKPKPSNNRSTYIYEKGFDEQHKQYSIPYQLGQELGKGGFAQCYSIRVAGEKHLFAVKVFSKHSDRSRNLQKINNEIEIMSGLRHEGIVRFYRKFETEDHIYMIMERCCKGSLSDVIKSRGYLTQPQVRYLISQLVPILSYLKENNVIHRDIKMGNIFFDDKFRVKLGDFGLSTYSCNHLLKKNICGTPNYIAPEIINRQSYGCQVDVWSTGILIHTLLLGKPPFEAKSATQTYEIILKCELTFQAISDQISISSYAVSFLKKLIEKNRAKRIKLEEIMQHPFMSLFEIPQQLELTFPIRCPSKIFMKRYSNRKAASQSCSKSSSNEFSDKKSADIDVVGDTDRSYVLAVEKAQFLKDQPEQSFEKTQQVQHFLKRELSKEQIQQYFSNVAKKFKTNVSGAIQTRTNRKKKLQVQQLVDKLKQICQSQPIIQLEKIKEKLKMKEENVQSQKTYNFYSFVRVIYLQKDPKMSYTVYLTNYYLMGLYFDDQSSIIHHLFYKKTFYLQHHKMLQSTQLSSDIVVNDYQGQFKIKLQSFSQQLQLIKQLLRNDNYIKNATSVSLDEYHAFCFVTDIYCGKHCKVISFSNGDITLFKNQAEAFALSTQKQTIELYCQGIQQAKLQIYRICQLSDAYRDKLKKYCRSLFEMPARSVTISRKKEQQPEGKDECIVQPVTSGYIGSK